VRVEPRISDVLLGLLSTQHNQSLKSFETGWVRATCL
jgi:hypothetical protein